jgi:hypothetical protein
MSQKIKILLGLFIILNVVLFLRFHKNDITQNKFCGDKYPDMTRIYQFGEYVENIPVVDRYGKVFNLNNYTGKPLIMQFLKTDTKAILVLNDSLTNNLGIFIKKGLNIAYITIGKKTMDFLGNNTSIYYDSDSMNIFKKYKATESFSHLLLLDKNRKVLLSTVYGLSFPLILEIINNKNMELFE